VKSLTEEGSATRIFETSQPNLPVVGVSLSPDGRYALATDGRGAFPRDFAPGETPLSLIDVASGEVLMIDPEHYVLAAGWNPDGTALAYLVFNGRENEDNGLYITATAGTPGTRVLEGEYVPSTSLSGSQPLVWSSRNTLMISHSRSGDALLVTLAQD
jgi:hypothetical protein